MQVRLMSCYSEVLGDANYAMRFSVPMWRKRSLKRLVSTCVSFKSPVITASTSC
jgi:hypothetical protein